MESSVAEEFGEHISLRTVDAMDALKMGGQHTRVAIATGCGYLACPHVAFYAWAKEAPFLSLSL